MLNEIVNANIPNMPLKVGDSHERGKIGKVSGAHFHDEVELLYIKQGVFSARNDDIGVTARAGEIIFINSRVVHETYCEAAGTQSALFQFDLSEISQSHMQNVSKYFRRFLSSGECAMYHFRADDAKTAELRRYLEDILREKAEAKKAYELYIGAGFYNILAFLHRYEIVPEESRFFDENIVERVLPALNYIDTHYRTKITLEELSRAVNLNPSYFCRLFKRATHSTFTEYLNFVRVCRAEKLILAGQHTVSEVSMSVGFSSVSYFNRIFKRYKGCTPSGYKKVKYAVK